MFKKNSNMETNNYQPKSESEIRALEDALMNEGRKINAAYVMRMWLREYPNYKKMFCNWVLDRATDEKREDRVKYADTFLFVEGLLKE